MLLTTVFTMGYFSSIKRFPSYQQADSKDCGPTCLKVIAKFYGVKIGIENLRQLSETTREGSSLLGLCNAAENIGFNTFAAKTSLTNLIDAPMPCIVHWNNNHYMVLYKVKRGVFYLSDPARGLITYGTEKFLRGWIGYDAEANIEAGVVLFLEPTAKFYKAEFEEEDESLNFGFLIQHLKRYKSYFYQLTIGVLAASLLQLTLPFLTQSIIDVGIKNRDIDFIYLILIAQLFIFIGSISIEIVRGWILLHVSSRINISLVSSFFLKLTKLPIAYFDSKMTGDLFQRINDHHRVERIITSSSLNVLFSTINIIVFGIVLWVYNFLIFGTFAVGSILYFGYILFFLKRRKELDYLRFESSSKEQGEVIELINGMQEIKLQSAERSKRWSWEALRIKLFKISIKSLTLEQLQSMGSRFINEIKNIIITILAANLVIEGSITLGMMLAITYIVGQLNSPIAQFINFIRELQDAKISLTRLNEIHRKGDEEEGDSYDTAIYNELSGDIRLNKVAFRYNGSHKNVLKDISLKIPKNKITAIVGSSGSGKTTLLKLILKYYNPIEGEIFVSSYDFSNVSPSAWRKRIGVVMQEGYIFNDSITKNIVPDGSEANTKKVIEACKLACIHDFIITLPNNYNTKIGSDGVGLSSGQKQRILIARAIYKNPEYIFLDEATSSLDATNEKLIHENLQSFFFNRTVLVIAHRLSTVKNADQIVVIENGEVVELGNHTTLIDKKGYYYNLVKNQLELN